MSQEWKLTPAGALERTFTYPSGLTRTERANPKIGKRMVVEKYSDARRVVYSWDPASDVVSQGLVRTFQKSDYDRIEFLDPEGQTWTRIFFPKAGELQVHVQRNTGAEGFDQQWDDNETLTKLSYYRDGLSHGRFQAEPNSSSTGEQETSEWQVALPILINYLRNPEPLSSELFKVHFETLYPMILRKVGLKPSDPIVEEAHSVTKELYEKLVGQAENPEEARELLDIFGMGLSLAMKVINIIGERKSGTVREAVQQYGIENVLSEQISSAIEYLNTADSNPLRRVIQIYDVGDITFSWKEIEIEGNVYLSKESLKRAGVNTPYGTNIPLQDSIFGINRDNGRLNVTCSSNRKGKHWTMTSPLVIPFQDIADIYTDPSADFREIKPLLHLSFK